MMSARQEGRDTFGPGKLTPGNGDYQERERVDLTVAEWQLVDRSGDFRPR